MTKTFMFGREGANDTAIEEHCERARIGWRWWVDQIVDRGAGDRHRIAEGWRLTFGQACVAAKRMARAAQP